MQQHFGGMQRNKEKEGMGKGKKNIRNILERLNSLGLQTNSTMPFLKRSSGEDESNVIKYISNYVLLETRWSFLQK